MIYDLYFQNISAEPVRYSGWTGRHKFDGHMFNKQDLIAQHIRKSEDNAYIFILTDKNGQYTKFGEFIKKYGLEENIIFEPPLALTNRVHLYNERNLRLVVMLSSTHFWRELYED